MQSDVVTDTAFPEWDVAVAKVIDDVLLDMGYVIFPFWASCSYPHCLNRNQDPSDDSLRSTSISLPNFVIRGYANGCACAF